jgi:hypothetical protein
MYEICSLEVIQEVTALSFSPFRVFSYLRLIGKISPPDVARKFLTFLCWFSNYRSSSCFFAYLSGPKLPTQLTRSLNTRLPLRCGPFRSFAPAYPPCRDMQGKSCPKSSHDHKESDSWQQDYQMWLRREYFVPSSHSTIRQSCSSFLVIETFASSYLSFLTVVNSSPHSSLSNLISGTSFSQKPTSV